MTSPSLSWRCGSPPERIVSGKHLPHTVRVSTRQDGFSPPRAGGCVQCDRQLVGTSIGRVGPIARVPVVDRQSINGVDELPNAHLLPGHPEEGCGLRAWPPGATGTTCNPALRSHIRTGYGGGCTSSCSRRPRLSEADAPSGWSPARSRGGRRTAPTGHSGSARAGQTRAERRLPYMPPSAATRARRCGGSR